MRGQSPTPARGDRTQTEEEQRCSTEKQHKCITQFCRSRDLVKKHWLDVGKVFPVPPTETSQFWSAHRQPDNRSPELLFFRQVRSQSPCHGDRRGLRAGRGHGTEGLTTPRQCNMDPKGSSSVDWGAEAAALLPGKRGHTDRRQERTSGASCTSNKACLGTQLCPSPPNHSAWPCHVCIPGPLKVCQVQG